MIKIRLFAIFLASTISLFSFIHPVLSKYQSDVIVTMQISNPIMKVNGVEQEIDPGMPTVPIILDDRTYVPIRSIIEAFGGIVIWDEFTRTVLIIEGNDSIMLTIGESIAYVNTDKCTLDTPPFIINNRVMLPIRFIAEKFNIGVAWEENSKKINLIRNYFDEEECKHLINMLESYNGTPYVYVNNNIPMFEEYEIIPASFEYYSDLDNIERCNVCMASVSRNTMPTEDRFPLIEINPTGWKNKMYSSVPGGYLYNRCHLIGYQLTGENDNIRNIITGTRYMNVNSMLPFENRIADYIIETSNHVLYRVTPVFENCNLLATGVLLEAYSVEDAGKGISICVFCYNVQPDIHIDYVTGDSLELIP